MKVSIILPLIAFFISVSVEGAVINSIVYSKELKSDNSLVNPSVSIWNGDATGEINKINSGISNTSAPIATEEEFSYLRFEVSRYADPDKDINQDINATNNLSPAEFDYLKFDVKKYADPDRILQDEADVALAGEGDDFSYLKFDVAKYTGYEATAGDEPEGSFSGK
jgi:hypothetical protein